MSSGPERLTATLADRYRLERELGAGGMATAYLAADLKHDRKVAIKVLKPELAAVLGAERFVQEIKAAAERLANLDGRDESPRALAAGTPMMSTALADRHRIEREPGAGGRPPGGTIS